MTNSKNRALTGIVWILQGILVGFGAILPGVSGGALLAAFGLYKPILDLISSPIQGIKKYFWLFCFFGIGGVIGFVGLSGLVNVLLEWNEALVKCTFVGFMLGTIPELWEDAGSSLTKENQKWHRKQDWLSAGIGFAVMLTLLIVLNGTSATQMTPGLPAYFFCGICWGLSFVIPGLSASTLLLFFGLYGPMLDGISRLNMAVCIPLAIGALVILALLPRLVKAAFARWEATLSHGILGIVLATTVMIFPGAADSVLGWVLYVLCIVCGCAVSYLLGRLCAKLKANALGKI